MYPLICSPGGEARRIPYVLLRLVLPFHHMPFRRTRQKGIGLTRRATRALLFSFSILYQATIYFPCPRYFSASRIRRSVSWPSTRGFFGVCVSSLPLADLRLLIPANGASRPRRAERSSLVDLVRREFQHSERENRAFPGL